MNKKSNKSNCYNAVNEFAVKNENGNIKIFNDFNKAVNAAIKWYQSEIRWQNNDLIIATKDMLDAKRAKMWNEIIKEVS